ncbi:M14 family metallopeptidase [Coraliomargarita sp. W4R53]
MTYPHLVEPLLIELEFAAIRAGFLIDIYGRIGDYPLFGMHRNATPSDASGQKIYLSSGIHGDEPAGPHALLELLQEKTLPQKHDYIICPLLNPAGLAAKTRENPRGLDLNRDYRAFHAKESRYHAEWMKRHMKTVDLCLHLHEDWESSGFYLYELNFTNAPSKSEAILRAVEAHLPIETANEIDGYPASDGIIRPSSLPQVEGGDPEAIYIQKKHGGINYTLESPSSLPIELRIASLKAAVLAAL